MKLETDRRNWTKWNSSSAPLRSPTDYTEAQIFWIVKRGIRITGMPAFGGSLSDNDIAQLAALVERFDKLPARLDAEQK
jgi:mono/diheme cytochrome c family protein